MRIAYLSIDEVNQDLAARLCAGSAAHLEVLEPRDLPPDGRFDGVVYDLDCLSPLDRRLLLDELSASPAPGPVAVHGYCLEDEQTDLLRYNGVVVHRRLGPAVFAILLAPGGSAKCRAVAPGTPLLQSEVIL